MKSFTTIAAYRGLTIKVAIKSRRARDEDTSQFKGSDNLVTKYRGKKSGEMSLIYDPLASIQISLRGSDNNIRTASIVLDLAHLLSDKLAKCYNDIIDNENLYVKDGNTITIDATRAVTEFKQRINAYTEFVEIYPGVDNDENVDEHRCIIIQFDGASGILPLSLAKTLIQNLDKLDVHTYKLVGGVLDQTAIIDDKLDKINSKLDMILNINSSRGSVSSGVSSGWAPAQHGNFDMFS